MNLKVPQLDKRIRMQCANVFPSPNTFLVGMHLFLPEKLSDGQVLALATAVSQEVCGPEELVICDFYRVAYAQFWTRYVQLAREAIGRMRADDLDNWDDYSEYGMNDCVIDAIESVTVANKCRLLGLPAAYFRYVERINYDLVYDVADVMWDTVDSLGLGIDAALGLKPTRFAWMAAVVRALLLSKRK